VHNDPLYQFYYNAALIAAQNGIVADTFDHPKTTPWTTGGDKDVLAAVAHVALGAMRTAWKQKFGLSMRIRPEVMAQRLELADGSDEMRRDVPGLDQMMTNMEMASELLEMIKQDKVARGAQPSLYLAGMFAEGSPTHPSLPAGHAVVAGAGVTVLKAMLKTFDDAAATRPTKWVADGREALQASDDGAALKPYADSSEMTINGELNKLASNVALGRDWAGVHYRADGDGGLRAGEEYAIAYLQDKMREYREDDFGLSIEWTLEKVRPSVCVRCVRCALHTLGLNSDAVFLCPHLL
jgi:hypothetical protein